MEIHFTKDENWLRKWDEFVARENCGSHLLLSDWIFSFESYGFESDFCICEQDGTVVGGYAAVIAKAAGFKFYIVPFGPVFSGMDGEIQSIISKIPNRAKQLGACYAHISLPVSHSDNAHTISQMPVVENAARPGHLFRYVYSSKGLNWIDLENLDEESKIMTLKPAVRRNIRNSYRKGLDFKILESQQELESAYRLFEQNAKKANYVIRDWRDLKDCVFALQHKGYLKMLSAYKDGVLKGAIMLVKSGNYYTYIMGGSVKEVPDLRTGDFLQWEAVKLSLDEGLDGYNISLGGSGGVIDFKNSFGTEQFLFDNGKFHWVLRPARFRFFLFFEKKLKPYKSKISKILSKLRK